MGNESPQTRTLRLVVQDNTEKNPLHPKASIWVRGFGTWWRKSFGAPFEQYVHIGKHNRDLLIYAGDTNQTAGFDVDYEMPPVAYPVGSTAYLAAGTIYIDFYDHQIDVHGVPIGYASISRGKR